MKQSELFNDLEFNLIDIMPDVSLYIKEKTLGNIPPNPSEWSQENLSKIKGMEYLENCHIEMISPDSQEIDDQVLQLESFFSKLVEDSITIDNEFCEDFPKDFNKPLLAFDTETTGLDTRVRYDYEGKIIIGSELVGLCLATDEYTGYYLPIRHTEDDDVMNWDVDVMIQFIDLLQDNFCLLIHNAQYDREIIAINGCTDHKPYPHFLDTLILCFQNDPEYMRFGLDAQSMLLLKRGMLDTKDLFPEKVKDNEKINFNRLPATHALVYGAHDAMNTYGVFKKLIERTDSILDTQPVPVEIDHKMSDALRSLYRTGLPVNLRYMINASKDALMRSKILEDKIYSIVGKKFNINSSQQLSKILFEDLKLPKSLPFLNVGKSGQISVDEGTLNLLFSEYPDMEFLKLLTTYKKLHNTLTKIYYTSVVNSYICAFMPWAKIQIQFVMTKTTGRLASSCNKGALHNLKVNIGKSGKISPVYKKGTGDAGLNCQAINSRPPYMKIKARKILKLPQEAGIDVQNPYSKEVDEMFIKSFAVNNDNREED